MGTDRIEKQVLLRAPLKRVWRALSDSTEFGSWFGVKFEGGFVPGARVRGAIVGTTVDPEVARHQKQYEGTPFEIEIEEMEPECLLSFRWHPGGTDPDIDYSMEPTTLVRFTLEQVADGVMLTVTESGFDRIPLARRAKVFQQNEHGWAIQVNLIREYLVGAA